MAVQTSNLFLLQDLEDPSRTRDLPEGDLNALRTVAEWIKTYVARPNKNIVRSGPVCPFVPGIREHKTLWLAPEQIAKQTLPDFVHLVNSYKRLLLNAQPIEGDKAIVVVFTDVSQDHARELIDDRIQDLKIPSYLEDGVVLGEFHEKNDYPDVRNHAFYPFRSPVPFLLLRNAVVGDWVFYLDNKEWMSVWARRFGESAVQALAEELRRTNWQQLDS